MLKFAGIVVVLVLGAVFAQEVDARLFDRLRSRQATHQRVGGGGLLRSAGGCAGGSCNR